MKRIEICGNIASGKTTLCKRLVSKKKFPILENFRNNPFIKKFYEDPVKFSFETEVSFLLQHYHLIKTNLIKDSIVCDFSLFQDIAYADVNLDGNKHKFFLEMVIDLQNEISFPSKIIRINCLEEILMKRIKKRNRDIEDAITVEYLKEVNKAITFRLAEIGQRIPIVSIDSGKIDFTKSIKGLKELDTFI